MTIATTSAAGVPVQPAPGHTALRPLGLGQITFTGGYWHDLQRRNAEVTIPHVLAWLERDGALDNFRTCASGQAAPRRSLWFSDSDVYKALEALAWEYARTQSPELGQTLARYASLVASAQEADGYLNTWIQASSRPHFAELWDSHEVYCIGHLIQAGIAERRSGAGHALFDAARRAADLLLATFATEPDCGLDGHPVIEMALVELTRQTGQTAYARLARSFLDARGHRRLGDGKFGGDYFQDAVPFRQQDSVVGHAVRAIYLLAGAVDIAVEEADAGLLAVARRQWDSMVGQKTYITGAIGSRFEGEAFGDPYELPPDLAYAETCAAVASVQAAWRLQLATGQAHYADLIERTILNAVAAAVSRDGDAFFYSNPLQRRRPSPPSAPGQRATRSDAPGTRPAWFECACCPPNVARLFAMLAAFAVTQTGDGVQIHQYGDLTVQTMLDAPAVVGPVRLRLQSDYPTGQEASLAIDHCPADPWTLALRVPTWAAGFTVVGPGSEAAQPGAADESGYVRIRRTWRAGDRLTVTWSTTPRLTFPHPAVDAVRGCVAIERGPIVYCLEGPDQLPGVELDRVRLDGDLSQASLETTPEGFLAIDLTGQLQPAADDGLSSAATAWPGREPVGQTVPVRLRAIPYFQWANRGPSTMRVWIPLADDAFSPRPSPSTGPADR